ncbi:MAG TPA: hypothetical protein VJ276_17245 [Thermoanaerobaculia bacterium]|nr:hypothetical protein [Thermoanaerobaculia bacterium]
MPGPTRPSEELLAAPLPEFIRDLGLAVAEANRALAQAPTPAPNQPPPPKPDIIFTINSAEIEVNVAISVQRSSDVSVGGSLGLGAFSVNASYKSTFGFKEEASSRIKILLAAKPRAEQ